MTNEISDTLVDRLMEMTRLCAKADTERVSELCREAAEAIDQLLRKSETLQQLLAAQQEHARVAKPYSESSRYERLELLGDESGDGT